MKTYAAIIVAAGQSSRLGKPKQLVEYKGKKLLQHAIDAVSPIVSDQYVVVLGAYHEEIVQAFASTPFPHVINTEWKNGMSSSLAKGLQHLLTNAKFEGVFLLVSDQPFVDHKIVNQLVNSYLSTGKKLIASHYGGTYGVPAFIHRTYIPDLLALEKDAGAKKLFFSHPEDLAWIDFPKGLIDIDTAEDLDKLAEG